MKTKLLLLSGALALLIAWQAAPIPPYRGPDHPGQPQWCQNKDHSGHKANCECKKSCERGAPEPPECKVYCRKDSCFCDHGCRNHS